MAGKTEEWAMWQENLGSTLGRPISHQSPGDTVLTSDRLAKVCPGHETVFSRRCNANQHQIWKPLMSPNLTSTHTESKRHGLWRLFARKNASRISDQIPDATPQPRTPVVHPERTESGTSSEPSIHSEALPVGTDDPGEMGPETTENAQHSKPSQATKTTIPNDTLKNSAKKLGEKIPEAFKGDTSFEGEGSVDLAVAVDRINSQLVTMMAKQNIDKSLPSEVQCFAIEWAKKSVPFFKESLSVASV